MTREEKIKRLAALDGRIVPVQCFNGGLSYKNKDAEELTETPNYLASYDAIIPLIQKRFGSDESADHDFIEDFWNELNKLTDFFEKGGHTYMLKATPEQLVDALLAATGKDK